MGIPKYEDLMLPLLKLSEDGDVHTLPECTEKLADIVHLTEEERKELLLKSKSRTIMYDRVYWAKQHLKEATLLESTERGKFRIAQEGIKTLKKNLSKIDDVYLLQFDGFVKFLERSGKKINNKINVCTNSPKEMNKAEAEQLLGKLKNIHFNRFEDLMLEFLLTIKYGVSKESIKRNIRKTHDDGLDGYIELDVLGLDKIYIQAKRWDGKNPVSNKHIRDFSGAIDMQGGNKGLFITTSRFTPGAMECSKAIKNKSIRLIDGNELVKLMLDFNFEF